MRDYYQILGVDRLATPEQIKKAYRSLAKKFHPDVVGDDAKARAQFEEITKAYETLTDKDMRKAYDSKGPDKKETASGFKPKQGNHTAPDFSGAFDQFFGFKPEQTAASFDESAPMKTDDLFQSFFKPKAKNGR